MEEVRLLELQVVAYEERLQLCNSTNMAYKEKVDTLNANLSNLTNDLQTLNQKVTNKNHFIIGATIVAFLEGALIYFIAR